MLCQSGVGEEDFCSNVGISSHEGKRFTAPISFTPGVCDLSFNSSLLSAERLAEEKDLARFFSS